MSRSFLKFIENEKQVAMSSLFLLACLLFLTNLTKIGATIACYLLMGLWYFYFLQKSIRKAQTIITQILWLLLMPFFISWFPLALFDLVYPGDIFEILVSAPILYIIFFTFTWIIAVFLFEFAKIKVAIQFINAGVLTILGISFIVYFVPELTQFLFGDQMIVEIKADGVGVESILDFSIKALTLPYLLACIWANFAIEVRAYRIQSNM